MVYQKYVKLLMISMVTFFTTYLHKLFIIQFVTNILTFIRHLFELLLKSTENAHVYM